MAPNYMPSMNFFYRLIAIFSLLGLANGLLFMASIRTRRSVWQGMGSVLRQPQERHFSTGILLPISTTGSGCSGVPIWL